MIQFNSVLYNVIQFNNVIMSNICRNNMITQFQHQAMAAIFLAAKIEEHPRRIRDVINCFHHIKQVKEKK